MDVWLPKRTAQHSSVLLMPPLLCTFYGCTFCFNPTVLIFPLVCVYVCEGEGEGKVGHLEPGFMTPTYMCFYPHYMTMEANNLDPFCICWSSPIAFTCVIPLFKLLFFLPLASWWFLDWLDRWIGVR